MWLFTTDGFYSAVTHRDEPDVVLVRARVKEDAERLIAAVGHGEVLETPHGDYAFRVLLPRATWAAYGASAANAIDYPNFKAAVAARDGAERADAYGAVWAVLYAFQERQAQRRTRRHDDDDQEETSIA
jgi:hypothetical protein